MLTTDSLTVAVLAGNNVFEVALLPGDIYQLASTTNAWFNVTLDPAAGTPIAKAVKQANGSMYIPANWPVEITGPVSGSAHCAIVRDTADGFATLTRISG